MINFEKKYSIERMVGTSKEEEKAVKEVLAQRFKEQDVGDLKKIELEKTPEEIQIIDLVNKETDKLLAKYDLPRFDISSKNVHLFDKVAYRKIRGIKGSVPGLAHIDPEYQAVFVGKGSSKVGFAKEIYHEFIHFKSYQAVQRTSKNKTDSYRFGLMVYSRNGAKHYFENLNEAVTEELSKRFYFQRLKHNPLFKNEIEEIEKVRKIWLSKAKTEEGKELAMDIAKLETSKKKGVKEIITFSYREQRQMLNNLLDKLYRQNKKDFKTKEEIFELFAKSMLSGNLLPIGRLIDHTFGKGTFRKIGELDNGLDNNIKKQKKFLQSL